MGHLWRAHRAAKGVDRSALPSFERWEVIPHDTEGEFVIGRAIGMRGLLAWNPLSGNPHCLVSGSTGGGKTKLMARWALSPFLWNEHLGSDWGQTIILDPKGGAGYKAARESGALVVSEMADIRDTLAWVYEQSEERNRIMGTLTIEVTDAAGIMREGTPEKFGEVSDEDKDKYDFRPTLVLIDEGTDVFGKADENKPINGVFAKVRKHANDLVQKGRSAGFPVVIGLVRPDAAVLGGSARAQLQARVAVGAMDDAGYTMMLGQTEGKKAAEETESMTPGQAWAVGVGDLRAATRVYVGFSDLTAYLPEAIDPNLPADERAAIIVERERRRGKAEEEQGEPEREEFPADLRGADIDTIARAAWQWLTDRGDHATRREIAEGIGANLKTIENIISPRGPEHIRAMFVQTARGARGANLYRAAGTPPRRRHPFRGGSSRGVRGGGGAAVAGRSGRQDVRQDVRAVVTGPFVRTALRVYALRLVVGPVKEGRIYRDPRVVWQAQDKSTGRCRACGRAGQLNVHHVRDLWAGGADHPDNVVELCQRTGKPSCHGAYTQSAAMVRDFRRRIGTYHDGTVPTPLRTVLGRIFAQVPTFYWPMIGVALLGFLHGGWWWWVLPAWVLLGPVWAITVAKAARRDLAPHPDRGVDPRQHRQVSIEMFKAKLSPRKFWARFTLRHHERTAKRDFARIFAKRLCEIYLTAHWSLFLLTQGLPILFTLLLLLL